MNEIPLLLLAAGGSSRMGQPKQLIPWAGAPLIEHQIRTLMKTGQQVNVVLGFNSDLIIPIIKNYPVNIFVNTAWESGMGSSVSFGILRIMQEYPKAEGVLITLLDQPLITSSYFRRMIDNWQPGSRKIAASQSPSGWTGAPVVFDKCYFSELTELRNDEGAKNMIRKYEKHVIIVQGGEFIEDMDTPESYQQLWNKYSSP
jgi:molybdenum cofactor cytidylyltransferase